MISRNKPVKVMRKELFETINKSENTTIPTFNVKPNISPGNYFVPVRQKPIVAVATNRGDDTPSFVDVVKPFHGRRHVRIGIRKSCCPGER